MNKNILFFIAIVFLLFESIALAQSDVQKNEVINKFQRLVRDNTYQTSICDYENPREASGHGFGCNESELKGSNWYKWCGPDWPNDCFYRFYFSSDGKIVFCGRRNMLLDPNKDSPPCPSGFSPELIGIVEGSDIDSIRWIVPRTEEPVWIQHSYDWSSFMVGIRPLDNRRFDPNQRYNYWSYTLR